MRKIVLKMEIENFEKMEMENFVNVILSFMFCEKKCFICFYTHLGFGVCFMAP